MVFCFLLVPDLIHWKIRILIGTNNWDIGKLRKKDYMTLCESETKSSAILM